MEAANKTWRRQREQVQTLHIKSTAEHQRRAVSLREEWKEEGKDRCARTTDKRARLNTEIRGVTKLKTEEYFMTRNVKMNRNERYTTVETEKEKHKMTADKGEKEVRGAKTKKASVCQ